MLLFDQRVLIKYKTRNISIKAMHITAVSTISIWASDIWKLMLSFTTTSNETPYWSSFDDIFISLPGLVLSSLN